MFFKSRKGSNNMLTNDTEIYQKMLSKNWFKEKNVLKREKAPYYDYQKLFVRITVELGYIWFLLLGFGTFCRLNQQSLQSIRGYNFFRFMA